MKTHILILSIYALVLSSCKKSTNCGDGGCETEYNYVKKVGEVKFQDSTAYLLPDPMEPFVTYKNDKGFSCEYKLSTDTFLQKAKVRQTLIDKPCCDDYNVEYITFPKLIYSYIPVKPVFSIQIIKEKGIDNYQFQTDSMQQAGYPDLFTIYIGDNKARFSTGTHNFYQTQINFLSSVTLNSKQFLNVYRISGMTSDMPLYVKEIFFKPGLGIAGFIFSNNEVWSRE